MLLLTQNKEIVNLDRITIIDTASLNIYARQGNGERGIILGGYDSEERCKEVVEDIFDCVNWEANTYSMPEE
jgi:hypothetical protein